MIKKRDEYATSRILYIIEAALEYFVAISIGTVYLANITAYIGISDSVTGVMSAFVSLGCGFQILAIFLAHKTPVKRWVTTVHIISQTLFAIMYFIPLLNTSKAIKTLLLIITLFSAQIMHNAINSPKINWLMSLVDEGKRGRFTANKEIVSLIGGMIFSYILGYVTDYFESSQNMKGAFVICGGTIIFLMGLHTLTLVFTKEKEIQGQTKVEKTSIKDVLLDKTLIKVALVFVLWNIASYTTVSFMGTYQRSELAFTTGFCMLINIIGSVARAVFSRPIGKFADKHTFEKMLYICFSIEAVAFLLNVFTTPQNGRVMYMIYFVLYCIGNAGINSSIINLTYDYVDVKRRTVAIAIVNTLSGFAGFFATLLVSLLVKRIQENGNRLFGIEMYAQQLNSAISFVVTLGIILYMLLVVRKMKKR